MFGLSWDQIILVLLAALFLLGPERIPGAIHWIFDGLRKVREMASGAQSKMRSEMGPELDELRRQVAELQSLKELQELRQLRDLDPRRMVGKSVLGDEFSGGVKGFLGLQDDANGHATADGPAAGNVAAHTGAAAGATAGAAAGAAAAARVAGNGASDPTPATGTGDSAAPATGSGDTAKPGPTATTEPSAADPSNASWLDSDIT